MQTCSLIVHLEVARKTEEGSCSVRVKKHMSLSHFREAVCHEQDDIAVPCVCWTALQGPTPFVMHWLHLAKLCFTFTSCELGVL